jgi:hypothetical protein
MKLRHFFFLHLLLLAIILSACASGPNRSQEATLQAVSFEATLTESAKATENDVATQSATPAATKEIAAPTREPIVVFETALSFSEIETKLIWDRVVTPYIHWYADLEDHPPLATMYIKKVEMPGFLYSASVIFEEGIHGSWIMSGADGIVDWWYPECLGSCPISEDFRSAYPEIMAIIEP